VGRRLRREPDRSRDEVAHEPAQTRTTAAASVEGSERLRLFLALPLPGEAVETIAAWQAEAFAGVDVRVVPPENLHVTLAFLGSRPVGVLPGIVEVLRETASKAAPIRLAVERYRETRSVAMLALADEAGAATAFAGELQAGLEAISAYRRDPWPWLPHVTVARFKQRPRLQEDLADTIRTCVLVPSDAAAYLSRPGRAGVEYQILESAPLGAPLGG
jgi:RNA 2',3'-cyclic 3'-phosphodiesterase